MLETLYKVKTPEDVPVEQAEYYELVLDAEWIKNRVAYLVREHHGWWDDASKRNVNSWVTFSPEEGYETYEEALQRYQLQRITRAKSGFVHSLSPDPYGDKKYEYELIEV